MDFRKVLTDRRLWAAIFTILVVVFGLDVQPAKVADAITLVASAFLLASGLSEGMRLIGRAFILASSLHESEGDTGSGRTIRLSHALHDYDKK